MAIEQNGDRLGRGAAFFLGAAFAGACAAFLIDFEPQGLPVVLFEVRAVKWLLISSVTALGFVLVVLGVIRSQSIRPGLAYLLVTTFVVWAIGSGIWTPYGKAFFLSLLHVAQMALVYLLVRTLEEKYIKALVEGFSVAAVSAVMLLLIYPPAIRFHAGFGNENFVAEFLTVTTVLLAAQTVLNWHLTNRRRSMVYALLALAGFVYLIFVAPSNLQLLGLACAAGFALWWL